MAARQSQLVRLHLISCLVVKQVFASSAKPRRIVIRVLVVQVPSVATWMHHHHAEITNRQLVVIFAFHGQTNVAFPLVFNFVRLNDYFRVFAS